jgi:hypothetical protein
MFFRIEIAHVLIDKNTKELSKLHGEFEIKLRRMINKLRLGNLVTKNDVNQLLDVLSRVYEPGQRTPVYALKLL